MCRLPGSVRPFPWSETVESSGTVFSPPRDRVQGIRGILHSNSLKAWRKCEAKGLAARSMRTQCSTSLERSVTFWCRECSSAMSKTTPCLDPPSILNQTLNIDYLGPSAKMRTIEGGFRSCSVSDSSVNRQVNTVLIQTSS